MPQHIPFVEDLLARMTLDEKIGQMTQPEKNSVKPGDVARLGLGSVLSGGGGNPDPNSPRGWRDMVTAFIAEAQESRLKIPLLYGSDAVHGHNNVVGATIFPHNVGLGATNDPELLRRIGRATALEAAATNVRWAFAPAVSIPQDFRWGRSYEGYGQDPALVGRLAAALVEGFKGEGWNSATAVLPSVKHFIADGATDWGSGKRARMTDPDHDRTLAIAQMGEDFVTLLDKGAWQIDQGDSTIDEETLRAVHLPPYRAAIEAGALNVMVSYSSWQGLKMHAHCYLITDVLKGELGFEGFVVSDWEGVQQVSPDFDTAVRESVNAGVDMVMVPFDYESFIASLRRAVEAGEVSGERIDDAVRRILNTKHALGLFGQPHTDPALLSEVGSDAHRALAREAAAKSAVLLKNGGVFPLPEDARLLVAGKAADDLGLQCGGWTITWMGGEGATTTGTTLLEGLRAGAGGRRIEYAPAGEGEERFPVGLVVLAEEPYAEGMGDRSSLALTDEHRALVARMRARCDQVAVVLYSGRPLIVAPDLEGWDAFVAAWLPGSEGAGLADVLLGARPFTGRLSFDWPRTLADLPRREGSDALFRVGAGQTTDVAEERSPVTG
ncbi:glycoside hydrolase family 3 C-terminal domain-containing protein [Deinococcus sp. HMF7604]|uniref:glycoside hydrolase family 3 protein n=1 Tax=Deinococcus betulae TaxID=2873312 RepID=UPI001CCD9D09|nr:glycoside hydrolase family 3 N-terminal domain-containing protein [Deinococcus betulae]MBZ9751519.1 glycoside hydrolase family 3 C-terminal domain-containing protein [Deinococcus betulae]